MYVFGYGSLLSGDAREPPTGGVPARLRGWRRSWGVAMDNMRDLAGYKHYLDSGGARPALHVAFLDIAPEAGAWVNGLLLPVDAHTIARLDRRERNYHRLEVGGQVPAAAGERVWTYVGRSAPRERVRRGLDAGRLAVSREYHDRVLRGFAGLGHDELADFHACTVPLPCPLVELHVIDHRPSSTVGPARALSQR